MTAARSLQPTLWRTCRVLANRARLQMLGLLLRHPNQTVSAVARQLKLSLSVASQYLRALEARGLLRARRVDRRVKYRIGAAPSGEAAQELIEALRRAFEREPTTVETLFNLATAFTQPRRIEIVRALKQEAQSRGQLKAVTGMSARLRADRANQAHIMKLPAILSLALAADLFAGENSYRAELAKRTITITVENGGPYTMEKTERKSPTLGAKPPPGAIVLFDGTTADAWVDGHVDERHLLAAGCKSKENFTNFTSHIEFLLPFKPLGRGQDRGNSGVYLQDRYELQVLDSFVLKGENNECGGIYSQTAPSVNMCFPPLTWQTYDIDFTSAKYDETGKKTKNAVVTIRHNGVAIHENLELTGPTPGGKKEDPSGGPLQLQGHGNPVFYRNIWVVPSVVSPK